MKQIAIASGKGGAGKTSLSASLLELFGKKCIAVDADVDAANLEILAGAQILEEGDFISGYQAVINQKLCRNCGACANYCRFNAIEPSPLGYQFSELACEGCGLCTDVCPADAIELKPNNCGRWFSSNTEQGSPFFHARLHPAEDNSGKLVTHIRKKSQESFDKSKNSLILIDAPPGIGCPLIAAIGGVNLLVLLTESSVSGFHDIKRLVETAEKMQVPCLAVLNKTGLNPDVENQLRQFFASKNIEIAAEIPFSEEFVSLLENKKNWLHSVNPEISESLNQVKNKIEEEIKL